MLGIEVMPNFAGKAEAAVDALRGDTNSPNIDENEFIDASRLVYDGVRKGVACFNTSLSLNNREFLVTGY